MASVKKFCSITLAILGLSRAQEQIPFNPSHPAPLSTHSIPALGFGTWNLDKSNASDAVSVALQTGYRHLDCAAIYGNEKEVGQGIKHGLETVGLDRSSIWITSKLWNDQFVHTSTAVSLLRCTDSDILCSRSHQFDQVEPALDKTLSDLSLDYLDLYLMHWPVASSGGRNYIDYVDVCPRILSSLNTVLIRF